MSNPSRKRIVAALLERHGRTYCDELHIDIARGTPSPLFRLLCASLLMSARIGANMAVQAADALAKAGWRTPRAMADATWEERTRVLNRAGYARYDESTSRMLADTAELVISRYGGDLRRLREEADGDPAVMRRRLQAFKGIGGVGADIFLREAQAAWPELRPYADARALKSAERLGLDDDAAALARLVDEDDFARFVAALVRAELAGDHAEVREAAGREG